MIGEADAPGTAPSAAAAIPRPASTVMVVRDGDHPEAPLEVLMLRRTVRSDFAGGAHVFPGGALDVEDAQAAAICEGLDDATASAALGMPSGGLAWWVAAVRECFEEAGLLYARAQPGGPLVALDDPAVAARFAQHRRALNAHDRSFLEVCAAEGLVLALDRLRYVAHWVTPRGAPRRYDTRFFVAVAPDDQTPAHDAGETDADVWVRPADALEAHRAGAMVLILPTIRNLQAIGRFDTVAELVDAAGRIEDIPVIEPRVGLREGAVTLLAPGDPGYDDAADVASGPLDGGFEGATQVASRRANER